MKTSFLMLARRVLPALLLASVCWASVASGAETEESPLIKAMGWKGECHGAPSDMAEFRRLLEAGADPNECDTKGNPLLMLAAENHHAEAVKLLLEFGADTEICGAMEWTALHAAVATDKGRAEQAECVRLLLQAGAKTDEQDENGLTPLALAARNDDERVVMMLLEAGADPTLRSKGKPGWSALELLEKRGSEACIRRARANVPSFPKFEVYPACGGLQVPVDEQGSRRPWVLWELISAEARPAAKGQRRPIMVTARVRAAIGADAEVGATVQGLCNSERFDEDVLQTYFEKGRLLWMHPDEELPELWNFYSEQFMELAEALPAGNPWKQAAAVVREHTAFGREAEDFLHAMQQDDAAEVKRMLDAGFDLTRRDAYVEADTPWMMVLRYYYRGKGGLDSKTDYMQMLMDAGVDISQPSVWGDTPLSYAARRGLGDLMRLLLAHGADASVRSEVGNTVLHAAAQAEPETGMPHEGAPEECERLCRDLLARYAENIRTLVAAGADVNAVNDAGETPLSLAVLRMEPALVEVLLEQGADACHRDSAGNTMLHLIARTKPHYFPVSESCSAEVREAHEHWNRYRAERYHAAVSALLAAGADPHAANAAGETPLSLAEKGGNAELVKLLREHAGKDK